MGYFSDRGLNVTVGDMQEEQQMDRIDGIGTSDRMVIERYNTLAAIHHNPSACFICGAVRRLFNALVQGPSTVPGVTGPVAGRGHGVCRPCIKAGAATALR